MGKKAAGEKGRAAQDDGSAATPPASLNTIRTKRGKNSGWPWWLWVISAIGILAVVGQIFGNDSPKSSGKKGKAAGKSSKGDSTQVYLGLAMRLAEMTQIATALKASEQLDGDAASTLDDELTDVEKEIENMEGSVARDLRSMVSVIRGTLYQNSQNLTDEQVEKMNNSFTYANPRYWDDYYKKLEEGEKFDWYVSWDTGVKSVDFAPRDSGEKRMASKLGDIVGAYMKQESKILMLGCGNSDMSEKMYKNGFEQIVNIDISEQLMQNLRQKQEAAMPKMQWLYMSASEMTFDTGSFDVIVDKGTLDAVEQNRELVLGAVRESHRTLRSGGVFISVTFNPASIRIQQQLEQEVSWSACYSHSIEKELLNKKDKHATFYVHACEKP